MLVSAASSVFRFFADRQQNENYLKNDIQSIFWYCRGVTAKPGVGETYAEHPSDVGPDGLSPTETMGSAGSMRMVLPLRWRRSRRSRALIVRKSSGVSAPWTSKYRNPRSDKMSCSAR